MDADFAHLTKRNLARRTRWKHCSFLRQGTVVTTEFSVAILAVLLLDPAGFSHC